MLILSRALLTLWLAGIAFSVTYGIATIVWGQGSADQVFRRAGQRLLYGIIWPLALFTSKGRKQLATVFAGKDQ